MTLKSKWIETIYCLATSSRGVRNFFTPLRAIFYGLLIFAFVLMGRYLDHRLGLGDLFPRAIGIPLSLPLFLLALLLIGWSVHRFFKARGTPVPFNPPNRLVTSGPYAHSRNPMLSGVFFLLFGMGAFLGSISLCLIFTPLFILLNV